MRFAGEVARSNRPTVSVVIPTFKRRSQLPDVLAPLLEDPAASEVVVVVDGARDGSIEYLRAEAARAPRLLPLFIDNRGENGARQAGLERASGDIVLFLDDDVVPARGLVTGHSRAHDRVAHAVIVGYMPVATPAKRQAGDFATFLYATEYERRCAAYESGETPVLHNLWAGNFSLQRAACLSVGLTSGRYTVAYHADRELGLRFAAAGLEGIFERSLRGTHLYRRPLPSFVRDARAQGAAKAVLAELHPDAVSPPRHEDFVEGLPFSGRWLVRLARRPRASVLITTGLRHAVATFGRLRLFALETVAARLLRRVAQQDGALELARAARRGGPASPLLRPGREP